MRENEKTDALARPYSGVMRPFDEDTRRRVIGANILHPHELTWPFSKMLLEFISGRASIIDP